MHVEVKLYSYHDMDLVSLYKSGRIVFPETTRQILNSYANKEVYKVKLLKPNHKREQRYPSDTYRKYYHYHVDLDEEQDAQAIKLLENITPGCRNNFIKVLLRQYICCEIPAGYSINGETKLFKTMTALFQNGLDEKEIRQTKRKGIKTSSSRILNAEEDITATVNHHHSKNRDNEKDLSITHNPNKLKPKQENNKKENLEASVQEDKVLNYEESEKAFNQNSNETSELTKNHYNTYEDNTEIKHNENDDSFVDKGEPETNPVESYDEDYSSEYDDDFDIDAFLSGATEQY